MKRLIKLMGLMLVLLGMTTACEKEERGYLTIRMRDPAKASPYDAVNLDVRQLQIYYTSGSSAGWVSVKTQSGIYNLLKFQNGPQAQLVRNEAIAQGTFSKIKIILGENNTIISKGKTYPIMLEPHVQAGIDIDIQARIVRDGTFVIIGFDSTGSIAVDGPESFRLKPVVVVQSVQYGPKERR